MVTIEAALAVATLLVATVLASVVPSAVATQIRCAHAAREVALLVARDAPASQVRRGVSALAPEQAEVSVSSSGGWVTVRVASTAPTTGPLAGRLSFPVSGTAVARLEPSRRGES